MEFPRPAPIKLVSRRGGKSALMWHQLRAASAAAGRPIVCVNCWTEYTDPPKFGGCPCGSYGFGIKAAPPEAVNG